MSQQLAFDTMYDIHNIDVSVYQYNSTCFTSPEIVIYLMMVQLQPKRDGERMI
jgi:hypothetical protein